MPTSSDFLAYAQEIDEPRAHALAAEHGRQDRAGYGLGVLLGTAFPALNPTLSWQFEAIERLLLEGLAGNRERAAIVRAMREAISNWGDELLVRRQLRRAVWAAKVRVAVRELLPQRLGGENVRATARELSHVADAMFEVALDEAQQVVERRFGPPLKVDGSRCEFVAFGMGKLGGEELNAGSDVDIVFLYETDDGQSQLSLHEHFTRVARRAVHSIEAPTEDGSAWRVDLRLRPEGARGPIVNSLAAAERYYETWGRLWERAALLRCRPIAGDLALGVVFQRDVAAPFVFPQQVDPGIATMMIELVQRSRSELSPDPARDLKLGRGGIREAEFFIQSLQLIWGGREPSVRVPGCLAALQRLRGRGLVTHREARSIEEAYLLLRQTEHRIQFMTGIQTHLLPSDAAELDRLARTMEYPNAAALLRALGTARERVATLFESLAPRAPRALPRYHEIIRSMEGTPSLPSPDTESSLADPDVLEHLRALARRPDGLLGALTRDRYPELADEVLRAIAQSPDPYQAALYLRAFFGRFSSPAAYVVALAEDAPALNRLVYQLGASAMLGDAVVSQPDIADLILFGAPAAGHVLAAFRQEVAQAVATSAAEADRDERREALAAALRRAKHRAIVSVAVADLAGVIDTREATRILSDVADEQLERATCQELGQPPRGLTVIAVGKLGGRDIGYGSDLDVLFVYDPDVVQHAAAGEFFVRSAQRIIRSLSEAHAAGPGYELDTRLRPSGAHGMLVASLAAFARYHQVALSASNAPDPGGMPLTTAAPWERQALIRARVCAGDRELGAKVLAVAEVAAYERGAPEVTEMHRLRLRMQRELTREHAELYDLKLGHGGLLDVEFATQWLQMRHGSDLRVRTADTSEALTMLAACDYLAPEPFESLRLGYQFLRRLEQRIHVLRGGSSSEIDLRRAGTMELARRMGFQDSARSSAKDALVAHYVSVTRSVRQAYLEVLGLSSDPSSGVER